jgi:hypothetical protein
LAALLALALSAPSLPTGLAADDYIHALILRGSHAIPGFYRAPLDLFRFVTPEYVGSLVSDGDLPWWTDPHLRFAFFRPLSAFTHWLDYLLWPNSPWLMHAHNMVWAAIALLAVGALYRRVFEARWVAALAFALYALDDARAPVLGCVANRNALVACAFSVASVVYYVRWLDGSSRARWPSLGLFALGLLSGEGAVGGAAYLLAAALFLDRRRPAQRLSSLLPYLAIGCVWLGFARALGYGVARSGEYVDPLGDTRAFLSVFPTRALVLLFSQFGGGWSDWWNGYEIFLPGFVGLFFVLAISWLAFVLWMLWPLLRRSASARFWMAGCLLSVPASAAAFPGDRLLTWIGIGAFGITAEFIASVLLGADSRGRLARFAAGTAVIMHLVIAPLQVPMRATGLNAARALMSRADAGVPRSPDVRDKTIVLVNPPSDALVCFMPATRAALGVPRPRLQRALATGTSPVTVTRVGERTLSIAPDAGYLFAQTERMFRSTRFPLAIGDRVVVPGLVATVVKLTRDGRPGVVNFEFDQPLDDPGYVWRAWRGPGYVEFAPPLLGQSVHLPGIDLMRLMAGENHPMVRFLDRAREFLSSP